MHKLFIQQYCDISLCLITYFEIVGTDFSTIPNLQLNQALDMHFLGQAYWQAPQSTHTEPLINLFPSFSFIIHPTIHTLWQVPQPTQSNLLIFLGIVLPLN